MLDGLKSLGDRLLAAITKQNNGDNSQQHKTSGKQVDKQRNTQSPAPRSNASPSPQPRYWSPSPPPRPRPAAQTYRPRSPQSTRLGQGSRFPTPQGYRPWAPQQFRPWAPQPQGNAGYVAPPLPRLGNAPGPRVFARRPGCWTCGRPGCHSGFHAQAEQAQQQDSAPPQQQHLVPPPQQQQQQQHTQQGNFTPGPRMGTQTPPSVSRPASH